MSNVQKQPVPTAELQARHEAATSRLNTRDLVGVRFPHCSIKQSLGTVSLTVRDDQGGWSWIQDPPMSRRLQYENVFVPYVCVDDWNNNDLGAFFPSESVTFPERAVLVVTCKLD